MATQLFKDGKSVWVEANRVQQHLQLGWSADDPSTGAPELPATILPRGMGLENLAPAEQEAAILRKMGIHDISPLNPAGKPMTPQPIVQIGAEQVAPERTKRKYTRRNASA